MNNETDSRQPAKHAPHAEPRGPLPIGTPRQFGRYETWRVLGSGQFGRVYLAHDPLVERFVAIKSPKDPLPPETHRSFLREARAIADIFHPNICPVYDVGTQDESPFIVMRYIRGGTLNDLITHDPPTTLYALRLAEQLASGLDEAHSHGVFHRDLKPANILYDEKARRLLLTDFGLARWLESSTATTGGVKGTPAYMAPEQWSPGGTFGSISARTDVYCLGVVLYQLLTGTWPFDGNQYELMRKHCEVEPRRPSDVRPDLDPALDELCLTALAKRQGQRYGTMREFADAIACHTLTLVTSPSVNLPADRPAAPPAPPPPPIVLPPADPNELQRWPITVPGRWYARPVADPRTFWKEVVRTPAEVVTRPDVMYQLWVSQDATDDMLEGLEHLQPLTGLQSLLVSGCDDITDAALVHVRSLTQLQWLTVAFCERITDAGLYHLRELTNLRTLYLTRCTRTTAAGVAALQHALPDCRIVR